MTDATRVTAAVRARPAARVVIALLVGVVALSGLAAFVAPTPASAHAVLLEADPPDGAALPTAPTQVSFTFNEPVQVPTGGVRVFDADATRIDTGPVDTGTAEVAAVGLPADLPAGGYVAVYRVISADSHPVGGVLSFTVGDGTAVDDAVVAELFGGTDAGLPSTLGPVVRAAAYVGALLAAGALAFGALVAARPVDQARARRLAANGAVLAVVASVLALPVQGAAVAGVGLGEAFAPTVLRDVLGSSFGTSTIVRVVAFVGLLLLGGVITRAGRVGQLTALGLGAAGAASFALDGHQRIVEPVWLVAGADVVHLLGAAVWFGGLVLLALSLARPASTDAAGARATALLVHRFSGVALVSVVVLGVAGLAMAIPLVGSTDALTGTAYGRTLLLKTGLVVVVLAVAAYNRQRLVPAVVAAGNRQAGGAADAPSATETTPSSDGRAWDVLRQRVLVEVLVLVAVLGITAGLVVQRPAAEEAGLRGLYEVTADLGEGFTLDIVVDPNRTGLNQIHAYVLDETLRPAAEIEDLRYELTYVPEGIGPIPIDPFFAGTGHWVANTDALTFPGEWEIRVVAGVDRFTELSTTVTVPVAP
jgi:copper transport protein